MNPYLALMSANEGEVVNLDVNGLKVHFQKSCLSVLSCYTGQGNFEHPDLNLKADLCQILYNTVD
jgi:hypothetical protein